MSNKALPIAAAALAGACTAWIVYGALFEAWKIVLEEKTLELEGWPEEKNGYRIALIADFHIRDKYTVEMTRRAIDIALAQAPDMVVIAGDFVGYWKEQSPWLLEEALKNLRLMDGKVVGIPGNHDYWSGDAEFLEPVCKELGITLLRNEVATIDGIQWAGIDSTNARKADPFTTMAQVDKDKPCIALWHEADTIEWLPSGAALMLSGHSHGGQWRFPGGWTPMHSTGGEKYVEGFFPDLSTPLYVTRGIGTTGPPARWGALAEVSMLTLVPKNRPMRVPHK